MTRTNSPTITGNSKFEKIEAEVRLLSEMNIKNPNRKHDKLNYWVVPNINAKMGFLFDFVSITLSAIVVFSGILALIFDFLALGVFVTFLLVSALTVGILFAYIISTGRGYVLEKRKAQLFQRDLKWLANKISLDEAQTTRLLLGATATAEDLVQYVLHIENGIIKLHDNRLTSQPVLIELDNNFSENI